jgi:hypothetical protein
MKVSRRINRRRPVAHAIICVTRWNIFDYGIAMGDWDNAPVAKKLLGRCPGHPYISNMF